MATRDASPAPANEDRFETIGAVRQGLRDVNYLADEGIAGVVYLADRLGKPVLVEGPAGTGKTQLAKSVAEALGARLIRLQCYEGLDESKALYEWNYKKQLLRIQADRQSDAANATGTPTWDDLHDDIFSEEFLLTRPLLEAIRAAEPVVLLIDEVDRVEVETEALLLEVLSDYQVSIPELGTVEANQIPLVFLTSNNTRELSEALKRRCLFLHIDYPDLDREKEIVLTKVPGITDHLADQVARIVRSIRQLELKKSPSVSETLDWARTLVLLGFDSIDETTAKETLHILLKYQTDIAKAAKELAVGSSHQVALRRPCSTSCPGSSRSCARPGSRCRSPRTSTPWRRSPTSPSTDREAFKYALAATLVKNQAHWRSFETVFEVYFSLRGPQYALDRPTRTPSAVAGACRRSSSEHGDRAGGGGTMDQLTPEELAQLLYQALLRGDDALMRALARQAVTRYAGMEPGRPVGGTYYLYRTLRNLDLDGLLERLMEQAKEQVDGLTPLEERLERDEYQTRIDRFRQEVEAEIRRRLVADRGVEAMAKTLRKPLPEDVDFMHASRDELRGACARRCSRSPASWRPAWPASASTSARGPLDFRSTVRHSLSYGGVPAEPKFKYPRPAKPELMVVADISGSVAAFARFTLHLVYAIQGQFSKVRSFVFIDGIDEVTDYFKGVEDITEAVHRVNTEADVVWVDGHSDYGHAFETFWERWGREVGPKTTVLLLGDARNNYHAPQSWVIKEMRAKARHVYWLNPEPRSYWNTGDSIVGEYGTHTDGVYECRNLRQLEGFVEKLLGEGSPEPLTGWVVAAPRLTRAGAHPPRRVQRHRSAASSAARRSCTGLSDLGRRQAEALRARLERTGEVQADVLVASVDAPGPGDGRDHRPRPRRPRRRQRRRPPRARPRPRVRRHVVGRLLRRRPDPAVGRRPLPGRLPRRRDGGRLPRSGRRPRRPPVGGRRTSGAPSWWCATAASSTSRCAPCWRGRRWAGSTCGPSTPRSPS